MAKSNGSDKPGKKFVMVDSESRATGKNREPDGGLLYPAGRFALNSNASERWFELVRSTGVDQSNYVVKFGVDEPSKVVAAYVVPAGTPKSAPVRITPRRGAAHLKDVTLYLDGVFAQYGSLRPTGKRKVGVALDVDGDGQPYLEIGLQTQTATRTMPREGSSENSAQSQTAAAKQKTRRRRKRNEEPEPQDPSAEQPPKSDSDPSSTPT